MDDCQQFCLCFYVELENICIYMICKEEIGKKKKCITDNNSLL